MEGPAYGEAGYNHVYNFFFQSLPSAPFLGLFVECKLLSGSESAPCGFGSAPLFSAFFRKSRIFASRPPEGRISLCVREIPF